MRNATAKKLRKAQKQGLEENLSKLIIILAAKGFMVESGVATAAPLKERLKVAWALVKGNEKWII